MNSLDMLTDSQLKFILDKHKDCGRGDDDGPYHPDCPDRGTSLQEQCALAGCGFCQAAEERKNKED
jgi:hypothetical protein